MQVEQGDGFPHRALIDGNSQLGNILYDATNSTEIDFANGLNYDLPRC